MSVKPIPDGFHSVTPYLVLRRAAQAIEFYQQAFGAVETFRLSGPDGLVAHAEIKIGQSNIMLADEMPGMEFHGPETLGGSSISLLIYVPNVDASCDRAVKAGAIVKRPVADQFYGDRSCTLVDPFGHVWCFATHIEDVSPEEMQKRMAAMMEQMSEHAG